MLPHWGLHAKKSVKIIDRLRPTRLLHYLPPPSLSKFLDLLLILTQGGNCLLVPQRSYMALYVNQHWIPQNKISGIAPGNDHCKRNVSVLVISFHLRWNSMSWLIGIPRDPVAPPRPGQPRHGGEGTGTATTPDWPQRWSFWLPFHRRTTSTTSGHWPSTLDLMSSCYYARTVTWPVLCPVSCHAVGLHVLTL